MTISRRGLLAASGIVLLPSVGRAGSFQDRVLKPTPESILGPYYKPGAPETSSLREAGEEGLPLRVSGSVRSTTGERLTGALVEVWHADMEGDYDASGFRFRAKVPLDENGEYAFETTLPGHYSLTSYGTRGGAYDLANARPQHVHYRVTAAGNRELVTQLYFETDPFFRGDPTANLARDPFVLHRELVVPVLIHKKRRAYSLSARFDVILAPD